VSARGHTSRSEGTRFRVVALPCASACADGSSVTEMGC